MQSECVVELSSIQSNQGEVVHGASGLDMVAPKRGFLDAHGVLGRSQRFNGSALAVLEQGCDEPILHPGEVDRLRAVAAGGTLVEVGGEPQRHPIVPGGQAIVDGSRFSFDTAGRPWTSTSDARDQEKPEGVKRDLANELPTGRVS